MLAVRGRMMLIDDDELSRHLLELVAGEAGFDAVSCESGDAALEQLVMVPGAAVVLTDMQMPGLCGNELARRLREVCGGETILLAMSGSQVTSEAVAEYDGFLLKPFSSQQLLAGCERKAVGQADAAGSGARLLNAVILNEAVYDNFARGMPAGQLAGLYRMCLDDARKRSETMRQALREGDDAAYRRAAHAIKGGCGMVGAVELARLAGEMETAGLPPLNDDAPLAAFLAASSRLERMLVDKASGPGASTNARQT